METLQKHKNLVNNWFIMFSVWNNLFCQGISLNYSSCMQKVRKGTNNNKMKVRNKKSVMVLNAEEIAYAF